jgi:hypothetical protein
VEMQKVLEDIFGSCYFETNVYSLLSVHPSGRGSVWLERLVRDQEVEGSNPFTPIKKAGSAGFFIGRVFGKIGHIFFILGIR